MNKILRSRLPERFAERVPPLMVEIAIGVAMPVVMTLARMGLVPWTADRAPYAFVFVAAVGATVLAGLRSGILAIFIGQLLTWLLIVHPTGDAMLRAQLIGGLSMATFAQLIAVTIIWLYQQEIERAWSKREEQVDLIHQALVEIDHRTTNNYQTVLALILAQAKRASDAPVKQALHQVAGRIEAIALASKQLALSSDSLEQVRIAEHLDELCRQISRGLSRTGVVLECHSDELSLSSEKAIAISIIVNELATNALKHAFADDRHGTISVSLRKSAGRLRLEVTDNGVGMTQGTRTRRKGLGSRLIETFVKQLGAEYQMSSSQAGTRHLIHIPANV